jgi:hypothetical protein
MWLWPEVVGSSATPLGLMMGVVIVIMMVLQHRRAVRSGALISAPGGAVGAAP